MLLVGIEVEYFRNMEGNGSNDDIFIDEVVPT